MGHTYFKWRLLLGCTILCFTVNAQNLAWHKRVIREIYIPLAQPKISSSQKSEPPDTTLMEMLGKSIKMGNLDAYKTFDYNFSEKLTLFEINDSGVSCQGTDSITVVDPITSIVKNIYVDRNPHFEGIHKYDVLEEWYFDPHTAKTVMEIIGIAPVRDVYDDDNVYRGRQRMIWLRFSDMKPYLARYDRLHPTATFASYIWQDYFYSDINPQVVK